MEEFISENIRFNGREPKMSTIIGEQEKPNSEDIGSSGEPIGDLLVVFRSHQYSERLKNQDLVALAAAWKTNPVFEDAEEDDDLKDLPFDTGAVRLMRSSVLSVGALFDVQSIDLPTSPPTTTA